MYIQKDSDMFKKYVFYHVMFYIKSLLYWSRYQTSMKSMRLPFPLHIVILYERILLRLHRPQERIFR